MDWIYYFRDSNISTREQIDPTTINNIDGYGNTPLHMAIADGKLDSVQQLIRLGADVNAIDLHGHTPLLTAVLLDWPEVIPLLVDAGADLEYSDFTTTSLNLACSLGLPRVVKTLLELGANFNGYGKNQPLLNAVKIGSVDIINLLLLYGALEQQIVALSRGLRADRSDRTARQNGNGPIRIVLFTEW